MINRGILYKATGRYTDGNNVVGYHLVGEDGSQSQENRDRIIYLIKAGVIVNMRLTEYNGDIIIRGKGTNLNDLPVFDIKNQKLRDNKESKAAANSSVPVNTDKVMNSNPMGQFKIIKRIMRKNNCLGYVVLDHTGSTKNISRGKTVELALNRLISNAVAQKYNKDGNEATVLRGVNCDLNKLPVLAVDDNGQIIDGEQHGLKSSFRAVQMPKGGFILDRITDHKKPFNTGDYLVFLSNGTFTVLNSNNIKSKYTKLSDNKADCDNYIDNVCNYLLSFYASSKSKELTQDDIRRWRVYAPNKATA